MTWAHRTEKAPSGRFELPTRRLEGRYHQRLTGNPDAPWE